jgi:DnaJ-class molecular chaperone
MAGRVDNPDHLQAAHALLDWYEQRDWVMCDECEGWGNYIDITFEMHRCEACNGRGKVPPQREEG